MLTVLLRHNIVQKDLGILTFHITHTGALDSCMTPCGSKKYTRCLNEKKHACQEVKETLR